MKVDNPVLITGALGFVGLNLQSYLKSIWLVKSLSVRYVPNQEFDIIENVLSLIS